MKNLIIVPLLAVILVKTVCGYSNVYFSSEDRKYMRIHQTFISDIPADAVPVTIKTSSSAAIRGYGLSNNQVLCHYLVHKTDQSVIVTGQFDTLRPAFDSGSGFWMSPSTGDTLARFTTGPGANAVPIPDFYVDIAAKVFSRDTGIAIERSRNREALLSLSARPNPFNPAVNVGFALDRAARVSLKVFSPNGRLVYAAVLERPAGSNLERIDFSRQGSGVYLIRAEVNGKGHALRVICIR